MPVKLRITFALCWALAAIPAMAQVYSDGLINGNTDAWTINFGFAVSDTFATPGDTVLTGLQFGAWLFPGDVLSVGRGPGRQQRVG